MSTLTLSQAKEIARSLDQHGSIIVDRFTVVGGYTTTDSVRVYIGHLTKEQAEHLIKVIKCGKFYEHGRWYQFTMSSHAAVNILLQLKPYTKLFKNQINIARLLNYHHSIQGTQALVTEQMEWRDNLCKRMDHYNRCVAKARSVRHDNS